MQSSGNLSCQDEDEVAIALLQISMPELEGILEAHMVLENVVSALNFQFQSYL